jgi:hypothetical protein
VASRIEGLLEIIGGAGEQDIVANDLQNAATPIRTQPPPSPPRKPMPSSDETTRQGPVGDEHILGL